MGSANNHLTTQSWAVFLTLQAAQLHNEGCTIPNLSRQLLRCFTIPNLSRQLLRCCTTPNLSRQLVITVVLYHSQLVKTISDYCGVVPFPTGQDN